MNLPAVDIGLGQEQLIHSFVYHLSIIIPVMFLFYFTCMHCRI